MTAIAALVAEALAFAEANTDGTYAPSRFCVIRTDRDYVSEPEWGGAVPESFAKPGGPRVAYGRADFTLVALAHLAERLAEAEGRATAFDRVVREHWIEVAKKEVSRMSYALERLGRGHGHYHFWVSGVPKRQLRSASNQRLARELWASDEQERREFPRLIAQTKAAIADAEKGAPRG